MLRVMIKNWWLFACRAAFALVFGAYVWLVQGANLPPLLRAFAHASTVELFGLLAFGAGIFTLGAALRRSSRGHDRGFLLVDGFGACAAGALVVVVPSFALQHLVRIMGFWALFIGVCEFLMAQKLRRHMQEEWFLTLAGAGSFGLGAFLLLGWASDDHSVLAWLGSYALFSAIVMAGLAYRLWRARTVPHVSASKAA